MSSVESNELIALAQRLAAVERAVADLQRQLANGTSMVNWVERFRGSFRDEPAFAEVVAHGRAIRMADRPHENHEP